MAETLDIDIENLCHYALRRAGQPNPSAQLIAECVQYQFQEVKADIMLFSPTHQLLKRQAMRSTVKGVREYSQPNDLNLPLAVTLLDGPDEWRGTMTAVSGADYTLATDVDADSDTIIGQTLITTGGTGADQFEVITAWNNTTKVATVQTALSTEPDTTTTYLIADTQCPIWNTEKHFDINRTRNPGSLRIPTQSAFYFEKLWLDYAPDKIYGLMYEYYVDLKKLDQTGSDFTKILNEWRSLFMEGVVAKSMGLLDDVRAPNQLVVYNQYMQTLKGQSLQVTQTIPNMRYSW